MPLFRTLLAVAFVLLAAGAVAQPTDMRSQPEGRSASSSVPTPDPTLLTTDQLLRETVWLRSLIETRLDAMDKALLLLQGKADKVPSETDIAVGRLRDLHEEKFKSIQTQFGERDARIAEASRDARADVDKALQAARELGEAQSGSSILSIAKNEKNTSDQIGQLGVLLATNTKSLEGKVDGLKERIGSLESRLEKNEGRGAGASDAGAFLMAGVSLLGTLVAIGLGLAAFVRRGTVVAKS